MAHDAPVTGGPTDGDPFAGDRAGLVAAIDLLLAGREAAGTVTTADVARIVEGWPECIPATGVGPESALRQLAATVPAAPDFRGADWAAHAQSPKPWVAWAGSLWVGALGQDLARHRSAPVAGVLERKLQQWLAPIWGMNTGMLVADQAQANLTAMWVARDGRGAQRIAASEAAHVSVAKAARILGLQFVALPVDANETLRLDALEDMARREPDAFARTAVVLCGATPDVGAIDPITAARRAVASVGASAAWWHVDAGWAGPLALDRGLGRRFADVRKADSMATALHQMMFAPVPLAFVGFKDRAIARQALRFNESQDDAQLGLSDSRGDVALAPILTLLAYGSDGIAAWLARSVRAIDEVAAALRADPRAEVFDHAGPGVALWRPVALPSSTVFDRLDPLCASLVVVGGRHWIRHVAGNPALDSAALIAGIRNAIG